LRNFDIEGYVLRVDFKWRRFRIAKFNRHDRLRITPATNQKRDLMLAGHQSVSISVACHAREIALSIDVGDSRPRMRAANRRRLRIEKQLEPARHGTSILVAYFS